MRALAPEFRAYSWAMPSDEVARLAGIDASQVLRFDQNTPSLPLPSTRPGAVAGALARILLGSTLFAFWALFSIRVWSAIASPFWHAAVILPLALLFLLPLTGLMLGISVMVRAVSPKRHGIAIHSKT